MLTVTGIVAELATVYKLLQELANLAYKFERQCFPDYFIDNRQDDELLDADFQNYCKEIPDQFSYLCISAF